MSATSLVTKAAVWWIDRHVRAPRLEGFSVDDGMPDRGKRYGGAATIHNTGTIDVVVNESGNVTEVWFRCQMLAARVSSRSSTDYFRASGYTVDGASVVAVELAPGDHA